MKSRVRSTALAFALSTAVTLVSQAVPVPAATAQVSQDRVAKRYFAIRGSREVFSVAKGNGYSVWMSPSPGIHRTVHHRVTGQHKDSGANKYLSPNSRNRSRKYQKWETTRNGSYVMFKSKTMGLLLAGTVKGGVSTSPYCGGNGHQNWY